MSVEEIKALVRHFYEEVNKGETAFMAAVDELIATDYVEQFVYTSLTRYR